MKPSILRASALTMIVLAGWTFAGSAKGQLRSPDSDAVAVRPSYKWDVSLGRETRAVVGPIDAERELKIRIDRPDSELATNYPDESITVCLEHYCETVQLAAGAELGARTPELDFTPHLAAVLPQGPEGKGDYRKAYLTVHRRNLAPAETITVAVKVQTDHTEELPQFNVGADSDIREALEQSGASVPQ